MLINSDSQLRTYIPNTLATCSGEATLFDRLQPFLQSAESWLAQYITGSTLLVELQAAPADDQTRDLCCQVISSHAFHEAVPSLDLVLTPSGFGIVSNGNLSPASSDRIQRLLSSLIQRRDHCIDQLLKLLPETCADWLTTEQAGYFGSTIFPRLSVCDFVGKHLNQWDEYHPLRRQLVAIEQELANSYISLPLYSRLRDHALRRTITNEELNVVTQLRSIETDLLLGRPLNYHLLIALVNHIRTNPDTFPEWQNSPTAALFSQRSFQNTPKSAGYWW